MTSNFLTEREVAEIFRVSTSSIKRLRLSGKLRYLPGRPLLIDRADLDAYIEGAKRGGPSKDAGQSLQAKAVSATEAARSWALQAVLMRPQRRKPKG